MKYKNMLIVGGEQKHQAVKSDNICTTLTSSMGTGGGYVPMIIWSEEMVIGHLDENSNQRYVVYDKDGEAPTLQSAMGTGGGQTPYIAIDEQNMTVRSDVVGTLTTDGSSPKHNNRVMDVQWRIRKITPREAFRLMDFSDEDFDKAKYRFTKKYLLGGEKECGAKLKAVNEKPKHSDMETYASCTTKESQDMEMLQTMALQFTKEHLIGEKVNVKFAIEKLEELEHMDIATNTIRCFESMGMHFTLIKEKDLPTPKDIIVLAKKDKQNTEKYMKITMESNLSLGNIYIISILSALIIESKIFGSSTLVANICGSIVPTENFSKNAMLKISNLQMECTEENMSNSSLYKQAGNSIVQNVLVAALGQLFEGKHDVYKHVNERHQHQGNQNCFMVGLTEEVQNAIREANIEDVMAKPICLNSKGGRGGQSGLQPSVQDRVYSTDGVSTAMTTAFMPKILTENKNG